jgi:hypothetical protein
LQFAIDDDLKKEYLKQKPKKTAKSEYPNFVSLDEYEVLLQKPVYDFSLNERDELMMMKFRNSTIGSIISTASKFKGYIDFCVSKNRVPHRQNIFDTFTKDEAKRFVSQQATEFRFISKEKKREYQKILYNYQDKLLLELPYVGVRGRTIQGGTLEEIINLQIKPGSPDIEKGKLELVRNNGIVIIHYVSQSTMSLIVDTYNSDEYVSGNGIYNDKVRGGSRIFKVNKCENYVLRQIGEKKCEKMNPVLINSRIAKIQKFCDNPFITINNLYRSGIISAAMDIYKKNKEITKEDYVNICRYFKYGDDNPERYYSKVKEDVELYLKGGYADA